MNVIPAHERLTRWKPEPGQQLKTVPLTEYTLLVFSLGAEQQYVGTGPHGGVMFAGCEIVPEH